MAYRVTIQIVLGSGQVGLTLVAKLFDTGDVQVGSDISTGFTEIGLGNYVWDYSSIPTDFRGWVKFYFGVTLMTFTTIVPEDIELISIIQGQVSSLPDQWLTDLPAGYDPGQAGYILGQLAGAESVGSLAPVITDAGDLELVKGQDYKDTNLVVFSNTGSWPDLNGATIVLEAFEVEFDMEVADYILPTQSVAVELSVYDTKDLPLNRYEYRVRAQVIQGVSESVILARGRIIFTN